jgi:hypothetical protein
MTYPPGLKRDIAANIKMHVEASIYNYSPFADKFEGLSNFFYTLGAVETLSGFLRDALAHSWEAIFDLQDARHLNPLQLITLEKWNAVTPLGTF